MAFLVIEICNKWTVYKPIFTSKIKGRWQYSGSKNGNTDFFVISNRIFQSMKKIKELADKRDVKILNYSKDSFIDQFEKV